MKKLIVLVLLFVSVLCLVSCSKEAASIGIIGGADGPTAIFVTSTSSWMNICGFIGAIVVTILAVLIICRNKKKK